MEERVVVLENGMNINYRFKEGKDDAVLLLHFGGGTNWMWDHPLRYLKKDFTIIAPDLRGHGKSDKPEKGYHMDDFAEDIYLLLKELDIESCHVVGSSLGAEVGLSLAAKHPKIVKSLVCEGAFHSEYGEYGLFNGSNAEIQQEKEKRLAKLEEREAVAYATKDEFKQQLVESFKEEGIWNDELNNFIDSIICENKDGSYTYCLPAYAQKEYAKQYWDFKFEDYYSRLKCPVLFLPSEEEWKNDRIKEIIGEFSKMTPYAEVVTIPGAIHTLVWQQSPEEVSEAIVKFIANSENK